MNARRLLIMFTVVVGAGLAVLANRGQSTGESPFFAVEPRASRPYVSQVGTASGSITQTWYCPGVLAADTSVGGQVIISNPSQTALQARLSLFASDGAAPVRQTVDVAARSSSTIDIGPLVTATAVSAMVEIDSGLAIVEQRAVHPAGSALATCTTATSPTWYFADGFTVDDSTDQIILTNPYADVVIVDLAFYKKDKRNEPPAFQDYPIAPHSIKVISLADIGGKDETSLAVEIIASRGRLIVSRAQHYFGGGRLGFSLTLGAPALAEQLYFAQGLTGPGVSEVYAIFNPTREDVLLQPTLLGVPLTAETVSPDPIDVPANEVVFFDASALAGVPDGQHTLAFATLAQASVAIERVLTITVDDKPNTTITQGMTPEYVVGRWYVPVGVDAPTAKALTVYNVDNVATTVAVKAIGPGGEVAVPGLDAVPLPAGGVITIDLTDASAFGRTLVVESPQRLFVERWTLATTDSDRRSSVWAVPECGPCNISSPAF